MKFTVEFPVAAARTGEDVARIAEAIEQSGFDAIAFTEHPAPPRGWLEGPMGHPTLDVPSALSFTAAVTNRVRLMTYLLVLPYRNPFAAAQALATVDLLSSGRAVMVAGTGYLAGEFEALGIDMDRRNERFDECLTVMRGLWSQDTLTHEGEFFRGRDIAAVPPPTQSGGPPVYIGGNGGRARERAAAHDGWSPLMTAPAFGSRTRTRPITTIAELEDGIHEVRERALELRGEDAVVHVQTHGSATRYLLTEAPDTNRHREHLEQLATVGVDSFVIRLPHGSVEAAIEGASRYAEDFVRPMTRSA